MRNVEIADESSNSNSSSNIQWVNEKGTSYDCRMYASVKRNRWNKEQNNWFQFPQDKSPTSPDGFSPRSRNKSDRRSQFLAKNHKIEVIRQNETQKTVHTMGLEAENEFKLALAIHRQGYKTRQKSQTRTSISVSELLL